MDFDRAHAQAGEFVRLTVKSERMIVPKRLRSDIHKYTMVTPTHIDGARMRQTFDATFAEPLTEDKPVLLFVEE
jgi:hypothetical protein